MKKLIGVLLLCSATCLYADNVAFNRGLPSANLNNAAGAARSNVSWAFPDGWESYNWAVGDTFNLGTSGTVTVDDIRVWMIGTGTSSLNTMWSDFTLFLGDPSGNIQYTSTVNAATGPGISITPTTYPGGASYQGSSGSNIQLYQVDFLGNWAIDGSQTYTFFVGGTPTSTNAGLYGGSGDSPFLSASNAALSDSCGGCTQEGADNTMYYLAYGAPTAAGVAGAGTWDSNGDGWDKSSDVNVEVLAPEGGPGSFYLLLAGMACFAALVLSRRWGSASAPAN